MSSASLFDARASAMFGRTSVQPLAIDTEAWRFFGYGANSAGRADLRT